MSDSLARQITASFQAVRSLSRVSQPALNSSDLQPPRLLSAADPDLRITGPNAAQAADLPQSGSGFFGPSLTGCLSGRLNSRLNCNLNWGSLLLLAASVVLLPILLRAGYLREDIHQVLFPICLLAIWRLPRAAELRLPVPMVASVLVLWVLATLHVSGMLPELKPSGYLLIGRLDGDADGLKARGLYKRYSEIARTYQLMPVDQVYKTFDDAEDAAAWVALDRPKSPLIVFGEPPSMKIVLNPNVAQMLLHSSVPPAPFDLNNNAALEDGTDSNLRQSVQTTVGEISAGSVVVSSMPAPLSQTQTRTTTVLPVWWSKFPFRLRLLPIELPLPGNSLEQSLHFLAYLAQSLRFEEISTSAQRRAENLAVRRDALYGITNLDGPWGSGAMLGFAHYLLGTIGLIEAVHEGGSSSELIADAQQNFSKASSLVVRWHNPQLYVDIFNNAAVCLLINSQEEKDLYRAHRWLLSAFDIAGKYGLNENAATIQGNLHSLERSLNGPPALQRSRRAANF